MGEGREDSGEGEERESGSECVYNETERQRLREGQRARERHGEGERKKETAGQMWLQKTKEG